jgi:Bacterial extracellular solute-binding proteins, family 3
VAAGSGCTSLSACCATAPARLAAAGDGDGREGELDAVGVEGLLDEGISAPPDDELLARLGHHLHPDLDRELAELPACSPRVRCAGARLGRGRIDAAVASMSITEERAQRVDFTDKYYHASNRFVARRGTVSDISPSGLAGKRSA